MYVIKIRGHVTCLNLTKKHWPNKRLNHIQGDIDLQRSLARKTLASYEDLESNGKKKLRGIQIIINKGPYLFQMGGYMQNVSCVEQAQNRLQL